MGLRHRLYDSLRGTEVQSIRGWWLYGRAQQVCEYEAPNEDAIRNAIVNSGTSAFFPIASIDEAYANGPADIPGEFS